MTNQEATTAATVAEQGAHAAPAKTSPKKRATPKKGAPKARKPAKGAKTKPAASSKKKAPAAREKDAATPRAGSKGAKVLEMIARASGASLAELMRATQWQAHSIRGFLSTASKKRGLSIESSKNDKGERIYRIAK
jgi:Protein of unknown function (DUF3489)